MMTQAQNFKQYLGWGLVSTPAGRQYNNAGIDKQFNLGKIAFELNQDLGVCLPSPKAADPNPLCGLIYREINGTKVLGFSTYYSIYERDQTRAGTYFGSFIETVNSCFALESLPQVFEVLSELNRYQATHFIDWERKAYNTNNIANVAFDTPKALDIIQLQGLLVNMTQHIPPEDFLFIHCKAGELAKVAEKLLTSGLYYRYKEIFFSESEYICAQISQTKRSQIHSLQLFSKDFFEAPYKAEIAKLHTLMQEQKKESDNRSNEIKRLQAEQDRLVNEKVREKEQTFKQQVCEAEEERDKAIRKAEQLLELSGLGEVQLSKFSEGVARVAVQKANQQFSSVVDQKLSALENKMDELKKEARQALFEEERASSLWKVIWASISVLLFSVILGMLAMSYFSANKSISESEYKLLKEKSEKLSEKEKELTELQDRHNKLAQQNKENQDKLQTLQASNARLEEAHNNKANTGKSSNEKK